MELKQLEYFVRVAELGSFTQAALVLDVAQPTLSRQIRQLEVELRQNLLKRNGRGAVLTEAGKVLLSYGRGILHQMQRTHEELERFRDGLTGRVCVGLPPSIMRALASPLIREFRKQLPNATLSISEGLTLSMREMLQRGRLDIALLYNTDSGDEIQTEFIKHEDLFLIVSNPDKNTKSILNYGDPLSLQSIAEYSLLMPNQPQVIRVMLERELARLNLNPRIVMEVDSISSILDLVSEGIGSAVLTRHAVMNMPFPQSFLLHPINSSMLRPRLMIASSAKRPESQTQIAVKKIIIKALREIDQKMED